LTETRERENFLIMPGRPDRPSLQRRPHRPDAGLQDALVEACRSRGLPVTAQRRVVLEALAARDDHPTPELLYDAVRERLPGISRGTVYRVLSALVEMGLAVRIPHPSGAARFEARAARHHHLHCEICGGVSDVASEALDGLVLPRARGFEVHDFSIHFTGVCARCRSPRKGASA
jgi:Fur family peroxide stress response transcriptional regulator